MKTTSVLIAFAAFVVAAATADTIAANALDVAERMTLCPGTRSYQVTLKFNWTAEIHKKAFIDGGSFSRVVGISHNDFYTLFAEGDYASRGVQAVAETGDATTLLEELGFLKGGKVISIKLSKKPNRTSTITFRVRLRDTRYMISALSMVAPSPDWFVGVHDIKMCNTHIGKWKKTRSGTLGVYDAGTDKGTTFDAEDDPNVRPKTISSIASFFKGKPLGTWTITLV